MILVYISPNNNASYGDYDASFYISNGEIMNGKFPSSGAELVKKIFWDRKMTFGDVGERDV